MKIGYGVACTGSRRSCLNRAAQQSATLINMTENSEPVVDLSEALKFTAGDPEMLQSIIAMFLEEGPRQLLAVQECVEANDGPGTARAAHTLKGSTVIFGAKHAEDALIVLEKAGTDELADVSSAWERLQHEMRRLFNELQKTSN